MSEPIKLNEEISTKYESYSSASQSREYNTLDEPVLDTIKRDLFMIIEKIQITMSGKGDYEKIQREWDLWGPLFISLISAGLAAMSTKGKSQDAFTIIFIILWAGPLVIALNSRLLGQKINIIQTMCVIIYCSAPILFLTLVITISNKAFNHPFIFNELLSIGALAFTLRCNYSYFKALSKKKKEYLNLYPVFLFYTSVCLFIGMI